MYSRGDLLLVPYPFTDLTANKRRPVLTLTNADKSGDFVALPVTSRPTHENALSLSQSELLSGTLPVASWIRTDRIVTLHSSLVIRVFGHVSGRILSLAAEAVCRLVGHTQSA